MTQINLALLKKKKETVPEVEWWDVPFVGQEGYARVDEGGINKDKVRYAYWWHCLNIKCTGAYIHVRIYIYIILHTSLLQIQSDSQQVCCLGKSCTRYALRPLVHTCSGQERLTHTHKRKAQVSALIHIPQPTHDSKAISCFLLSFGCKFPMAVVCHAVACRGEAANECVRGDLNLVLLGIKCSFRVAFPECAKAMLVL